jgi:capsular exopolysaccharide synthesis family protein
MELKDYLRILRAHWVGVLVLTVIGLGLATAYNLSQPKVYEATSTGYVSSGDSSDPATASIADTLAKSRVKSYVDIATSTRAAQDVINSLGLDESPAALVGQISVDQPTDTVVIKISARAATPVEAQQLADAWVKALAREVAKVDGAPQPGQPGLRVVPYTSAVLPSTPVLPRTNLNLALGLVLGLLLGFGYALLRHQFDRRIRSAEEVERTFGTPVIGLIPQSASMSRDKGVALQLAVTGPTASGSAGVAEAFRKLRTNLAYMDVDSPPRIIVVTSPKQSDGKSTVAANLAAAIAVGGQAVTLIDGDLRRPTVARALGVVDDVGLTDVLVGRINVAEVLQAHPDVPGLQVLASGPNPPNPSELLGSQAMHALMSDLARESIVIVDAPPLLPVTDAAVLTRSADGALVVISHGGTLDSELTTSLNHISKVHGRTLGIIFNRMRRSAAGGYHYGDYTKYEYASETTPATTGKRAAKQPVPKP